MSTLKVNSIAEQTIGAGVTVQSPAYFKVGPYYDVRAYGAAGNGTADDNAAIASAVTAAAAYGGIVYLPPGTYLANVTFPAGKRVRIIGAGRGITVLKGRLTGTHAHLRSEWYCSVEDLTVDGNGTSNPIISLNGQTLFSMQHVTIRNGRGTGLQLTSVYDSEFRDVFVEHCGDAAHPCVQLDTNGSGEDTLNNCQFYNLHIEPGDVDAIFLDLAGNATNHVDAPLFIGLKVHGHPPTCNPGRPLVRVGKYAPGARFLGGIVAYGKGTSQIEVWGDRCTFDGLNFAHGTTPPKYAFQFFGSFSRMSSLNFKNNSYAAAYVRGENGAIHNMMMLPVLSGGPPILSDSGRNGYLAQKGDSSGGLILSNNDGFVGGVQPIG